MVESGGGGRGRYRDTAGDFPVAALRGIKTQANATLGMYQGTLFTAKAPGQEYVGNGIISGKSDAFAVNNVP
jgi:hypothetical protein